MHKITRQVLIELSWLALCLGVAIVFASILFGPAFFKGQLDIHLHDTYFIISHAHFWAPFFFLVTFIVYFTKEFRKSFRRTLPNWLLIITGLTLIVFLTFLIQVFSQVFINGWTSYPPLSGLGAEPALDLKQDPVSRFIANVLIIIQIIVVIFLLFISYRWGIQKQSGNTE